MAIWKRFQEKRGVDPETGKRTREVTDRVAGWQVQIPAYDPATGKRRSITIGTYRTKKEAEIAERQALTDRADGVLVDRSADTVGDLLDRWFATKRGSIAQNTLAAYEVCIRVHLKPTIGHARIQDLTAADVQNLVNRWRDTPHPGRGETRAEAGAPGLSARSIRNNVNVLNQAYKQAIRERLVRFNPVSGVELPAIPRSRSIRTWTPAEVADFLDKSTADALSPLWHLLVLEGMRRGEALGLRWSDLNWRSNGKVSAHISQTVVPQNSRNGRALIQPTAKTKASARTVLLTAATVAALKAHRDRQAFVRKAAGDAWHDHDLIICTGKGTPIAPANVDRNQSRIMKLARVPRLSTHDLRHTAATIMLLSGVPIKIVSEKLGHASVTITMDLYSHVLPDMQDQAADAMDAALRRGQEENRQALEAATR